MGRVERSREIARRRARRAKLTKLKKRYAAAKTQSDKTELEAKIKKVSPFVTIDG